MNEYNRTIWTVGPDTRILTGKTREASHIHRPQLCKTHDHIKSQPYTKTKQYISAVVVVVVVVVTGPRTGKRQVVKRRAHA